MGFSIRVLTLTLTFLFKIVFSTQAGFLAFPLNEDGRFFVSKFSKKSNRGRCYWQPRGRGISASNRVSHPQFMRRDGHCSWKELLPPRWEAAVRTEADGTPGPGAASTLRGPGSGLEAGEPAAGLSAKVLAGGREQAGGGHAPQQTARQASHGLSWPSPTPVCLTLTCDSSKTSAPLAHGFPWSRPSVF